MLTKNSIYLSIFFSYFIYANFYNVSIPFFDTLFILLAYLLMLQLNKKELFFSGFLIGIFWFWWISYSFIYYDLSYLIPLVILAIGILYGVLFFIIGLFENIFFKVIYIFALSFINPFEFNWFKIELPLINSYIGTSKIEFLILLIITAIFLLFKNKYRIESSIFYMLSILCLYLFNISTTQTTKESQLNIYTYNTYINQHLKWQRNYTNTIIDTNFKAIDDAIKLKYDLIILPETSFPLILNQNKSLQNILLNKSDKISILLGSLYKKDNRIYNSTYLFQKNTVQIAHKVVLVPFGESVPFPEKIRDWINNTFYDGASDYVKAKKPTTFTIKNTKFRNAICYEATTDKIYQNLDANYVIAISNNAWFSPSIQPTLQKLLMKYYSKKYNVYIYNVSNQ